jgi:hypothetical protein
MTPLERADRAKQLLEDPVWKAAFADIRERLVAQLETIAIGDHETQHEIALTLQLLKRLQGQLQKYVSDQAVDERRLKDETFIDRVRRQALQRLG